MMRKSELLIEYIDRVRDKPFLWGEWDCCQFVGQWVYELTGKDYRNDFPAYTSESGAREILESMSGLKALISTCLTQVHVAMSVKGDIVLSHDETGAALGICLGVNSAHVGKSGLIYLPTISGICVWRVE